MNADNKVSLANKVLKIMEGVSGRLLSDCAGPNKTNIEFWQVGSQVVILQFFEDGGVSHFVQGNGIKWDDMQAQLEEIKGAK